MVYTENIALSTRGDADMVDITPNIREAVYTSKIIEGTVTAFVPGSTGAITTIEFESGALEDLKRLLDELAPPGGNYSHNLRWGDGNGHSHLRAALLGPSLSVPVVGGELTLGTWQQVLFIDFDNRPRQRKIVIQIIGEKDNS